MYGNWVDVLAEKGEHIMHDYHPYLSSIDMLFGMTSMLLTCI